MALAPAPFTPPDGQPFRWTRERYDRLVDVGVLTSEDRVELLQGEIVEKMTQNSAHRVATLLAGRALREAFSQGAFVQEEKPIALADDSEPEPDLAVVRGDIRDYLDDHPASGDLLLLVEVSDTSLLKDRLRKARLYAEAAVPEYWIVNLVDRALEVHRDPAAGVYRTKTTFAPSDTVRPHHAAAASILAADLLP